MADGFRIGLHRQFRYEDRRIVYRGRARDPGRSYLFESDDRLQVAFTEEDIVRLRATGELGDWAEQAPVAADGSGDGKPRMARVTLALATEGERGEAERQQDYCMAWAANPGTPRTDDGLSPVIRQVHARRVVTAQLEKKFEPAPPCASALQKWIHRWLDGDRTLDALVPQVRMQGNRRDRLVATVREIVLEGLDTHYLTRARLPLAEVHRRIVLQIRKLNVSRPATAKLTAPTYDTVLRASEQLCAFTVEYCRRGPAAAKEKFRAIGGGAVTSRANEIWEIDDTRADTICLGLDGKTVIGRPWLTLVIDRHTRMIMSFVISFSPPDTGTAMEALRIAILPKADWLAVNGVVGKYPAEGRPGTIHVDNGKHYNSIALKRGLNALGIDHRTMPVLKAWYKGTVERLIGTVMRQVFHTVPGTTYSGIYERDRETPPESVAEATVEELRTKLLAWMVNTYQHRKHKGIDDKPFALWTVSRATDREVPPDGRKVVDALSHTVARTARKDGLQFKNLKYHSEHLLALSMLPKAERHDEVIVRVDRNDLTVIHFLHPITGKWLPAFINKDQLVRVEGRTLEDYELATALRRSRGDEFSESDSDYVETYVAVDAANRRLEESPKLGDRTKAAGAKERALRQAAHLTEPDRTTGPAEGESLSEQVDRAARSHDVVQAVVQEASDVPDDQAADFASRHGLKSRVSKPGSGG